MALLTVLIIVLLGSLTPPKVEPFSEENTQSSFTLESGQDESEKKEAMLLDKFRVLLGLGSLHRRKPETELGSPAPAPEPAEIVLSPSPAPVMQPIPLHPRRNRPPRLSVTVPRRGGRRRGRRILAAVLVSAGAALAGFAALFVCLGRRHCRRRNRSVRTVSVKDSAASQEGGGSKVGNDDQGFDLFYVNALTSVLEEGPDPGNSTLAAAVVDKEEDEEEEIVCARECEEPIKYRGSGRRNSSGDESFHSICESISSNNARLSNGSMNSFCDAADGFSPVVSGASSFRVDSVSELNKHPPPPPPPPPPLPSFKVHTSSSLAKMKAKSPSSILQNRSSSESPGSSTRSNGIPTSEVPKSPRSLVPPRPPSSIPPPPCPPMFMKGNSPRGAPPPPPPGQPPDSAALGKDGAPLPKLKPLHWDKVRATPDRSMVWDKLRSSSFEFDEEMIESLFGYSLKSVFQNDEGKCKTPSPNKHVLEPKRLQNMTILSKALNVTAEQVCEALLQGDGLRLQQLEALAKMEPTKEEENKMSNYKGNINELGSPEKLVVAMLKIPYAFQRIEAMLYRATFEDEVVDLKNSFAMLEEACKELRSSRLFLKLLEAVLKTGNRMNVGTIRGGAKAFKLDALLKLADVKGTDGKTTLLHFVVQEIIKSEGIRMADSIMGKINRNNKIQTTEEREEDYKRMGLGLVSGLSTELYNVKKTASIDLDVLATSVSNLSDGMAKLRKLALKDLSKDTTTSSNFICAMKIFITHAETSLRELQEHEAEVLRSVKEITEYFHGEVGKDEKNLLRIFVIVRDFMAMLDQVCRELRNMKTPKSPNPLAPFH